MMSSLKARDVLALVSVVGSAWGALLAVTGGVAIGTGSVVFRSHQPEHGFVVAALALAVLLAVEVVGRDALRNVNDRVERLAPWLAAGVALATLAAALAWNTWAAGGADSYGYVSQAHLFASGRVSSFEPLALEAPWPEAAWTFTPLGFKPGLRPGTIVPFYPPGLSVVMAVALKAAGDRAVYVVVPLLGALAVWMTFLLGRRLSDGVTGMVAAVLVAASPIFLYQLVQPMSDVAVVAWATAAVVLAARATAPSAALAGLSAGLAILTRPNLAPFAVPIAAFIAVANGNRSGRPASSGLSARSTSAWSWHRASECVKEPSGSRLRAQGSGWWRLGTFAAGVVPGVALLAFLQWAEYGSPLASGYGSLERIFSVQHVLPNLARYPRWLVESHTPLVLLALVAPAVLWSRRREDGGGERWLLGWVLLAVAALVFATYLFFTPFDDWAFLRYLLPAVPLLVALSAVVLVAGLRRLPGMAGTSAIALACGLLVWFSMQEAARRDVFVLKAREQKYLDAGAWVASRLPERAVILTLQQSGSLRLYADRLTVRWDLLDPGWLDPAIRFFDDHGRPPYLLVEGLEEPLFRARFGGHSRYGDLDWRPIAQIGVVRIYDPHQRP